MSTDTAAPGRTVGSTGSARPGAPVPVLGHPARRREAKDLLARVVMWLAFALALVPLVWILWTVASKGIHLLLQPEWWTNSQKGITSRREGKSVIYSAAYAGLSDLIAFLMRDCCQGHPAVCTPAVAALAACACPTGGTVHA